TSVKQSSSSTGSTPSPSITCRNPAFPPYSPVSTTRPGRLPGNVRINRTTGLPAPRIGQDHGPTDLPQPRTHNGRTTHPATTPASPAVATPVHVGSQRLDPLRMTVMPDNHRRLVVRHRIGRPPQLDVLPARVDRIRLHVVLQRPDHRDPVRLADPPEQ